jgi:23S rRNA pseudouridine1911/1915/1917 synthase
MNIKINVLRETPYYLVISKPVGISVHPTSPNMGYAGQAKGIGVNEFTIRDWLLERYPEIKNLPWKTKTREGIVHRLDKDTSGILILAKNPDALDFFQDQFRNREIEKHYAALVFGIPKPQSGEITALLRRDPRDRERQKVELMDFGTDEAERKNSATKYKVVKTLNYKGKDLALLDVQILTGRKHQIRTHMKYIGCPVLGDQKYFTKPSRRFSKELNLDHQLLHASSLKFKSYPDGEDVEIADEPSEIFSIFAPAEK